MIIIMVVIPCAIVLLAMLIGFALSMVEHGQYWEVVCFTATNLIGLGRKLTNFRTRHHHAQFLNTLVNRLDASSPMGTMLEVLLGAWALSITAILFGVAARFAFVHRMARRLEDREEHWGEENARFEKSEFERELREMPLRELKELARGRGLSAQQLLLADDSRDAKETVVKLIVLKDPRRHPQLDLKHNLTRLAHVFLLWMPALVMVLGAVSGLVFWLCELSGNGRSMSYEESWIWVMESWCD